jgi:hypothetical protein
VSATQPGLIVTKYLALRGVGVAGFTLGGGELSFNYGRTSNDLLILCSPQRLLVEEQSIWSYR